MMESYMFQWIGFSGGGVPPFFVFGRLQKPKIVQKEHFIEKIIAQKRCKYRCFCFLTDPFSF